MVKKSWLLVLAVLALSAVAVRGDDAGHTTVVEGNHFYSNYEINTTYKIDQVNVQKPIIFVLRKKDDSQTFDNKLTITFVSGERHSMCKFTSFEGMCFLDNLPSPNMELQIRCEHLPCEVSWTIYQPSMKKPEQTQIIEQMYDISESSQHMIATITCNNPEIKDFDSMVQAYSENSFVRGYLDNAIYLMFEKEQTGHLFFKIETEAKACAQLNIYNVKSELVQGEQQKDFLTADQSSVYNIKKPSGQFRIDGSFHEVTKNAIKSELILKITGEKKGSRQVIQQIKIRPVNPAQDYEFNWAIPKLDTEYENLVIEAKSSKSTMIFNYFLSLSERVEIENSEHSHFKLRKGEVLKYRLISSPDADSSKRVYLVLTNGKDVKISTSECSLKEGCQFEIEALADVEEILYAGENKDGDVGADIVFTDFKQKISKKIRENERLYLKTTVKKDEIIQVVVNNPNVIIRASSQQKCKVPSPQCYQHAANSHHPFIYQPKKDGNLLFEVAGLDNCVFTISIIGEGTESIELQDGEPFLYLFDGQEKQLSFKFRIKEKTGVSFNLISPVNELLLVVNNGKERPNPEEHTSSTDGYISLAKSELESTEFRVLVQKLPEAKRKSIHFTLIATTSGSNIRLDPGVAHIESIKPKEYKDFVFEFDRKGDYIINFYVPLNIAKDDINLKLLVNNQDKWASNQVQHMEITENSDVLNLREISEKLCLETGEVQCEIFVRVVNSMKLEADITVTLLVKDSVIELKEGIWQTYAINTIATTSHFYFIPKNKNMSVNVLYKSSLVDVGIAYTVWKSDKENIDPSEWPFPPYEQNLESLPMAYRSLNNLVIDTYYLKQCEPSCVILMSLYKKKSKVPNVFESLNANNQGNFSIMVANKRLQVPEKTKMELMLKAGEQKYLMVDLKYSLHKEALTFFTNEILGSASLTATVYTELSPRCPNSDDFDFVFGRLETQIFIKSIKDKLQEASADENEDNFLCILASAYLDSKITFEYTADQEIIKLLSYDTLERFEVQSKAVKMFQLEATQPYEIKFTREKGFFYVKIVVCNLEKTDEEKCIEDIGSGDRGKQIITKTEEFKEQPCLKCIVFIRVESDDYCEAVIHVQSHYSMIELKEKDVVSDFTNEGEVNKYSITTIRNEETIISVEVVEGEPQVTVTDFGNLNTTKYKDKSSNNIMIVIPPKKTDENTLGKLGAVNYDAYSYSNVFRFITVEVKSKDPTKSISYTISYSSGEREVYLEDGMAVGYTLEAKKKTIFLYDNPKAITHGYITITMPKATDMNNLKFSMFKVQDPNDEDTKVEVTPEKPPMRKRTPNPTIVYSLPEAKFVRFQLQSEVESKVTMMINHQELILLPYDQEFPFQMHKTQSISLLADVNNAGYLLVTMRKCDQSAPEFGYTFDYDSFQRGEFEYTTTLAEEPKYQFYIKAPKVGTLYMQVNVTQDDGLFAITVHYSPEKIRGERIKPGKSGVLNYQILDVDTAEVTFNQVACPSGKCPKQVKYYWMAGPTLQDVYTQTVCPYSYFQVLGLTTVAPLAINEIKATPNSEGVISFKYPYQEHVSYLAVKAVSDEEVYYQPIEVITLWGTVARAGRTNKFLLVASLIGGCVILLVVTRRCTRPDYKKLDERDTLDY